MVPMSIRSARSLITTLLIISLQAAPAAAATKAATPPQPKAPKRTTFDTYWGEKVRDDYQYMESATDPEVAAWAKGQDAYTRAWLDRHPERKALLGRIEALTHSDS